MIRKLSVLILFSFLVVACSSRQSSIDKTIQEGKPLVRVGDEKIHEGYLELIKRVNPGIAPQLDAPGGKKRILDNIVEQEMLYQESLNRGIDKLPKVQEKIALFQRAIIAQSLMDEELEKKAKEYYDQNKDKEFERVKVSHIFFSNVPLPPPVVPGAKPKTAPTPLTDADKGKANAAAEAKAKEAYARLQKGEAWDKVVAEMSEDKLNSSQGGDFGYISKADKRIERMEYQPLVNAAFALAKDAYSQPIKTKEGWHIIKVTEEKNVQPFDEVSMMIKFKLRGEVKNALMADLRKNMKVQYLDVSLAEPTAPPAMPTMPLPATPPAAPKPEAKIPAPETKPAN